MTLQFRRFIGAGFLWALSVTAAFAQAPPEIVWLGQVGEASSDATSPTSWSPQQLPDATHRVLLTGGGNNNKVLELGANDVTWYQMFPNNNGPVRINGTGTINLAIPYDSNGNFDPLNNTEWAIFTAGGEAFGPLVGTPSVINPNVVTESFIETNGGHSLTFNGDVTALTVQAYSGTRVTFNGDVTLTAAEVPDVRFLTGHPNSSITFNGGVTLAPRDLFPATGFGIRNGVTVNLGPNAELSSNINPDGWGLLNLYNGSTLRLLGSNRIGTQTQVFARGANSVLTTTLDLNSNSDHVSFMGTAGDATLIIDFGVMLHANSLQWDSHEFTDGQYNIINFQVGLDSLTLGAPQNGFWFETGDVPTEEARLAKIKIDGVSYAPFNPSTTTPYWTVVDPTTSRAVQFFNFASPNADFNGDGSVDGDDFLVWQRGLGLAGQTTNANGDADRNGTVQGSDLAVWRTQFGSVAAVPAAGSIPEPATQSMVFLGLCAAGLTRRRRSTR